MHIAYSKLRGFPCSSPTPHCVILFPIKSQSNSHLPSECTNLMRTKTTLSAISQNVASIKWHNVCHTFILCPGFCVTFPPKIINYSARKRGTIGVCTTDVERGETQPIKTKISPTSHVVKLVLSTSRSTYNVVIIAMVLRNYKIASQIIPVINFFQHKVISRLTRQSAMASGQGGLTRECCYKLIANKFFRSNILLHSTKSHSH